MRLLFVTSKHQNWFEDQDVAVHFKNAPYSIVYTYGSTIALHPLLCRRLLCRHKAFKVVHGWDDHYGRIWNDKSFYIANQFNIYFKNLLS